jgi:hypothetical protein
LGKITPGKTQCGKTSSSVCGFYYAAENIEISYRADRFTTMVEETPAKILPSTCTTLSKPNRTQQHKNRPSKQASAQIVQPSCVVSASHVRLSQICSTASAKHSGSKSIHLQKLSSVFSAIRLQQTLKQFLLSPEIALSQVHNAPNHQVDFLLSQ